jgi:hypothetical protein
MAHILRANLALRKSDCQLLVEDMRVVALQEYHEDQMSEKVFLGEGGFGKVYKVKMNGDYFVYKKLAKRFPDDKQRRFVLLSCLDRIYQNERNHLTYLYYRIPM